MSSRLSLENQRVILEYGDFYQAREYREQDREMLENCAAQYYALLKQRFQTATRTDNSTALLAIGRQLYDWLNADGWLQQLEGNTSIPWLLEITVPFASQADEIALLNAPWELLADSKGHLAKDSNLLYTPIRRVGKAQKPLPPSKRQLNMVFMAAVPEAQDTLSNTEEKDAILHAVGENLDITLDESGTLMQLVNLTAQKQPDLLHLSCHGGYMPSDVLQHTPVLFLQDHKGLPLPVSAMDLLELNPAQLIFLSVCYSTEPQFSDALSIQLLRAGFPALLSWVGAVSDTEANQFAKSLYQSLNQRKTLERAVAQARLTLLQQTPSPNGSQDWHLARLFLGTNGGGQIR